MKLLLDIGNARIKCAMQRDDALDTLFAAAHHGRFGSVWQTHERRLPSTVDSIWISNVAGPQAADELRRLCTERFHVEPQFAVVEDSRHGLRLAYSEPSRLGVDRWLAMVAACTTNDSPGSSRQATCIVDAGTAVTVDVIDADGLHLGGLIFPGPSLVVGALAGGTSGVRVEVGEVGHIRGLGIFGRDTKTAVQNGIWFSLGAALDRAIRVVLEEFADARVVMTGGDAQRLRTWLESDVQIRANLVLEGLAIVSEH